MSYISTNQYETVYILRPDISEGDASTIHQKVDSVIQKFKGSVSLRDEWGLKDLAYEVRNYRSGRICIVNYSGDSGVVAEIERHFKISNDVIRYLTVLTEGEYDYSKVKKQIQQAEEDRRKSRENRDRDRPPPRR